MSTKFLINMFFVLATASSLSTLQAMEEERGSGSVSARLSADPSDSITDQQIVPARASTISGEELSGEVLANYLKQTHFPVSSGFLDILRTVSADDLKPLALRVATRTLDGSLLYLFLVSSDILEGDNPQVISAFSRLEAEILRRNSPQYYSPYVMYFFHQFMFKGFQKVDSDYLTSEAFEDAKLLAPYYRYRSLMMQVWGALKCMSQDFTDGKFQSPQYFADNSYYEEALILADAFSRNPFSFFPENYVRTLKKEYEALREKFKGTDFELCLKDLSSAVEDWLQLNVSSPVNDETVQPTSPKRLMSAMKGKGQVQRSTAPKKTRFPEGLPEGRKANVDKSSPEINMWAYFVRSFNNKVSFRFALQNAIQHGADWLIGKEQVERGMIPELCELLNTPALYTANDNRELNTVVTSPAFEALVQKLMASGVGSQEAEALLSSAMGTVQLN